MIKRFLKAIINALFPSDVTCICCDNELRYEEERKHCVCVKCQQEINYIGDKPQIIENAALGFSEFFTVYDYEGKIKNIVVGFKDGKKAYLAEYIAKMLYDVYSQKEIKVDCVAYTPCSPKRRGKEVLTP